MGWIKAIADWLRKLTEPSHKETFLKRYRYSGNVLTLLANEETGGFPGLVSLWELSRNESKYCLIILLINVAQSKEKIGKVPERRKELSYQRDFEAKANRAIKVQEETILGTHLLLVGRISKEKDRGRWVNNEYVKFKHIDFLCAHLLNLQSDIGVLISGQNGYAERIVKAIAMMLLRLTPTELNSWDEFIAVWPWLDWLNYFATQRKETRFPERDEHILQPPRSKKARPLRNSL